MQAGALLKEAGCRKALIHYGSSHAVSSGLLDEIKKKSHRRRRRILLLWEALWRIPVLAKSAKGSNCAETKAWIFILAVGGGSVIDSAKAIGYGVANPWTDVWNFFLKTEIPTACLPVAAIPTIAASGSEMSNSCVITNEDGLAETRKRQKRSLPSPVCSFESPAYLHPSAVSDRKRMRGYPDAYNGAVFCQY